jgi:signal-transduction protein with cAMP-binding, CBS, and nucleotidyltransferase domain
LTSKKSRKKYLTSVLIYVNNTTLKLVKHAQSDGGSSKKGRFRKKRIAFMVKVREVMAKSVFTVSKKTKIKETADLMKRNGAGSLLVKDGDQIVGIITETDIVHKIVAQGLSPQITGVDAVMSFPLMTIAADEAIEQAGRQMVENGIRHLAVTQDGDVIGMISMRDLLRPFFSRGEGPGS